MVTKTVLALFVAMSLGTTGCGSGGDAEAKQAALAPASVKETPKAVPDSTPAAKVAPAETAAVAAVPTDSTAPVEPNSDMKGRETFSYAGGSRDPFVSLLSNTKIGPELPDLTLVAIYYDTRNPGSSVIVLREKIGGKKYSMRPGDRLGRIRLTTVRPKDVTFSVDDFGSERQETVSLRKQEEIR